jgi:hypothetical protein
VSSALYEAAQAERRPGSPDRAYYDQVAERLGGNRACLALARKLLKAASTSCANSATEPCSPLTDRGGRCARSPHSHRCPAPPAPQILLAASEE